MSSPIDKEATRHDEEADDTARKVPHIDGRILRPFSGKSPTEMRILVRAFLEETQLDIGDALLVTKSAFLAQDSHAFFDAAWEDKDRPDGLRLKAREKKALYTEATNKWYQPVRLWALVICCSLGAAVQGWDESAFNQAQGFFIDQPKPPKDPLKFGGSILHPSPLLGLVNSAPYLSAAIFGVWLTEPINRIFGRRGAIFISCLISFAACLGSAFVDDWYKLFITRLILGIGIGLKSTTVPIYASECVPKHIRGAFVMMWQMWTAFGIMLGFITGVALQSISSAETKWRLIVGSPLIFPLIVCGYIYALPESPRFLLLRAQRKSQPRDYQKAFEAMSSIRTTQLQAARDLFLIYHQNKRQGIISGQQNTFVELFRNRRNRNALLASILCMFFQQFCGVNVLTYYSTIVLNTAGYPVQPASVSNVLEVSAGFGILNFVFAIPAIYLIDTFGRRSLLLATFPVLSLFHLLTGLVFLLPAGLAKQVCVTLFMYLFVVAYSVGEGPVPFVYAAESLPIHARDLGMSVATSTNWIFNWMLGITFPRFWSAFRPTGTFAYYAAWCLVGFFLFLFFLPETKGYRLEELDYTFSIPMRTHARHGWEEFVWAVKCILSRRKVGPKPKIDVRVDYPGGGERERRVRKISFERDREWLLAVGDEEGEDGIRFELDDRYDDEDGEAGESAR